MIDIQINIYFSAFIALALSIFLNYLIFNYTKNTNYKKNTNEIRLSKRSVPPLGGIAIALSFLISVRLLGQAESDFITISFFGVLIATLGALDDFYNLNWKIKLVFQILFVAIPIILLNIFLNFESMIGIDLNNLLNIFISILWIVLLINSINFIDNMDGLAVVITGGICIQVILLTYIFSQNKLTDVSVILLFTMLGFFIFNFPFVKAAAIIYVPVSILSKITLCIADLNSFTPKISIPLFPLLLILHPIFFKKLIRSFISGSIAQFLNFVSPLEKQAAIKTFSVAPTDISGNFILQPFKPFFAEAKI